MITWNADADINGTSFHCHYLQTPWSFEETVARLIALTGQDPTAATDEYKLSVAFVGEFSLYSDGPSAVFDIYDWKGGDALHIGHHGNLPVASFQEELVVALAAATPTPYTARRHYDKYDGTMHSWGK